MRYTVKCALALLCWTSAVHAQTTNRWIGVSGKWETGANWSAGAPTNSNAANLITNALSKTVTIDTNTTASTLTISNLTLSAPGSSTNTLLLATVGSATPLRIRNSLVVDIGGFLDVNNSRLQVDSLLGASPIV